MVYMELFGNGIGNIAVADQVQVIEQYILWWLTAIQSSFGHAADTATGTVLEDDHGLPGTFGTYGIQLFLL